jgi:hypothetical protein
MFAAAQECLSSAQISLKQPQVLIDRLQRSVDLLNFMTYFTNLLVFRYTLDNLNYIEINKVSFETVGAIINGVKWLFVENIEIDGD